MAKAPERIWIDVLGVPDDNRYAGTYYLDDDDDHKTAKYIRADLVPQWQPIETAPKDGTYILACVSGFPVSAVVTWHTCKEFTGWCEDSDIEAMDFPCDDWGLTHWMPMPLPPKRGATDA